MNENDPHNHDEPSERDLVVLQSKATSILGAFVMEDQKMTGALMSDMWDSGCGPRMYAMSVWVGIALQACHSMHVKPTLVLGVVDDQTGEPRPAKPEEMSEPMRIAEAFVNVLISSALDDGATEESMSELSGNAFDNMHEYLHTADEKDAREAFISVLGVTGMVCKKGIGGLLEGRAAVGTIANADDDTIRKAFGL